MGFKCIALCSKCICNAMQEIVLFFFHVIIYLLDFEEELYFEIFLSRAICLYCSGFRLSQASCVCVLESYFFYILNSFC